jgi:hypothetical protein
VLHKYDALLANWLSSDYLPRFSSPYTRPLLDFQSSAFNMISVAVVAAAAAAFLPTALAHGGVLAYSFEGKYYQGFAPYNSASGQS